MEITLPAKEKKYLKYVTKFHKQLGISEDYAVKRNLKLQIEAKKFVYVGMEPRGRDHFLTPNAGKAWNKLLKSAKKDKIALCLISGFRSVERQAFLIDEIIKKKQQTIEQVLQRLAAPGYSEHHTGRAVDLADPSDPFLEERFEHTEAFKWLVKYASDFGFKLSYPRENKNNIIYEPWHWCFVE
jgi:D-alanyl-D-alanine carboxypeptidase